MDWTSTETVAEVIVSDLARQKIQHKYGRGDIDDSFFICDFGDLVSKHVRWHRIFPRVHPFFAFKACPYDPVVRCLAAMGAGFDCASKEEIKKALELGADPQLIIFANTCKQESHILFAKEKGVRMIVLDNAMELNKMKEIYPSAELVLRVKVDDSSSVAELSSKFGAPMQTCQDLMQMALQLQLKVAGICFHIGSGCTNDVLFVKALQQARALFDFAKQIGFELHLLDIGGGFPGAPEVSLPVEKIGDTINQALGDLFPAKDFKNLSIIAEPGRYYVASAFALVTNVIGKRVVGEDSKGTIEYFINDGIFGAFRFIGEFHENEMKCSGLMADGRKALGTYHASRIWGPTCDSGDVVLEECTLPELSNGDWILWENAGAYTLSIKTGFNGFSTTTVYGVISKTDLKLMETHTSAGACSHEGSAVRGC